MKTLYISTDVLDFLFWRWLLIGSNVSLVACCESVSERGLHDWRDYVCETEVKSVRVITAKSKTNRNSQLHMLLQPTQFASTASILRCCISMPMRTCCCLVGRPSKPQATSRVGSLIKRPAEAGSSPDFCPSSVARTMGSNPSLKRDALGVFYTSVQPLLRNSDS